MILDLDRLRMEYAKIYQVDEGSARREGIAKIMLLISAGGVDKASSFYHY